MSRRSKDFTGEVKVLRAFCGEVSTIYRSLDLSAVDPWRAEIKSRIGRFDLLILGKYNAGKTSLLNLLLSLTRDDLLPTRIRPTTRKLWKIGFSRATQVAGMTFTKDKPEFTRKKKLSDILEEIEAEDGEALRDSIDFYELGLPVEWLRRTGWFFWDSPGLEDPEGFLDNEMLREALSRAEAVLLATSYEGQDACRRYLEYASEFDIGCFVVVLTNAPNRTAEEFAGKAPNHLQKIQDTLKGHLSVPALFTYMDSKNVRVSLERCSQACSQVQGIIEQWRAGSSYSKDEFPGSIEVVQREATTVENGGFFNLWYTLETLRKIEEPLILQKSWYGLAKYLKSATDRARELVASAEKGLTGIDAELEQQKSKASFEIVSDGHEVLADRIKTVSRPTAKRKAQGARERAREILAEKIQKYTPGRMKKFGRWVTFGRLGGNEASDAEHFRDELLSEIKIAADDFVSTSVWPMLQPMVVDVVKQARKDLVARFAEQTGLEAAKHNAEINVGQPPTEHVEGAMAVIGERLWKATADSELRSSEERQKEFLDAVETGAEELANTIIDSAAKALESPLQGDRDALMEQAGSFFQSEVKQMSAARVILIEELSHERKKLESVQDLVNRCEEAIQKHHDDISSKLSHEQSIHS